MNIFLYLRENQQLADLWRDVLAPWIDVPGAWEAKFDVNYNRRQTVRLDVINGHVLEVNGAPLDHYINMPHDFGTTCSTMFDAGYHFGSVLDCIEQPIPDSRFRPLLASWEALCPQPRLMDPVFITARDRLRARRERTAQTVRTDTTRRPVLSRRKVEVLPLP